MVNRFIEFFFVGLVLGITEDLIAIFLVTNEPIDFRVFWIAFFVALPFAIFSELIVDHDAFKGFMRRRFRRKEKILENEVS